MKFSNLSAKKKVFILLILVLMIGGSLQWWRTSKPTVTQYTETKVERGSIATTVLSTGTVGPENRVEVKPPIAGRAESVLVKEGDTVRKGQTLVWMSSTERAALLDAARARGPSELKKWEEIYRPTPILAPVSGTIILRQIEPGQTFAVTDPILVMSDRLIVEAQVDETDLASISTGQKAIIVLDAYPKERIPAQVGSIAYEATTVNNVTTYIVKVVPESVPEFMRSGMTANVTFQVESRENTLLIPSEAIRIQDGRFAVLKRNPQGGEPISVLIETGLSNNKQTEVVSGLGEGDTVLIPLAPTAQEASPAQGRNPFGPPQPGRRGR